GRAGHVGHILLPHYAFRHEHDRQLRVGNALCAAESAISLTALTHQLGHRLTLDEWSDHPLNAADGTTKDKATRLRELAADGDALAGQLFDDQAKALGIALLSTNYLGDYDRLVIGGGVCDLAPAVRDRYRETAEASYHEHALDGFRNLDRLEFSVCGDEAPVIGALAWATP
ncbi:MAG: ROK family protein, partial [Planctomycetota bacterium]